MACKTCGKRRLANIEKQSSVAASPYSQTNTEVIKQIKTFSNGGSYAKRKSMENDKVRSVSVRTKR